jgi:hypothetical protein
LSRTDGAPLSPPAAESRVVAFNVVYGKSRLIFSR